MKMAISFFFVPAITNIRLSSFPDPVDWAVVFQDEEYIVHVHGSLVSTFFKEFIWNCSTEFTQVLSFIFQPLAPPISSDSKSDEEQLNNTSTTEKESDEDDDSDYVDPTDAAPLKPDGNTSTTTAAKVGNLHGHGRRRGRIGYGLGCRVRGHEARDGRCGRGCARTIQIRTKNLGP